MSQTAFAGRFKTTAGIEPIEYLTRWRMVLAASAMQTRASSLSRIGSMVGYSSESAFSTGFKRVTGRSPRRYGMPPQHSGALTVVAR